MGNMIRPYYNRVMDGLGKALKSDPVSLIVGNGKTTKS